MTGEDRRERARQRIAMRRGALAAVHVYRMEERTAEAQAILDRCVGLGTGPLLPGDPDAETLHLLGTLEDLRLRSRTTDPAEAAAVRRGFDALRAAIARGDMDAAVARIGHGEVTRRLVAVAIGRRLFDDALALGSDRVAAARRGTREELIEALGQLMLASRALAWRALLAGDVAGARRHARRARDAADEAAALRRPVTDDGSRNAALVAMSHRIHAGLLVARTDEDADRRHAALTELRAQAQSLVRETAALPVARDIQKIHRSALLGRICLEHGRSLADPPALAPVAMLACVLIRPVVDLGIAGGSLNAHNALDYGDACALIGDRRAAQRVWRHALDRATALEGAGSAAARAFAARLA